MLLDRALTEVPVWLELTGCAVAVSISLHDDYWPVIGNMFVFPSASPELTTTEWFIASLSPVLTQYAQQR